MTPDQLFSIANGVALCAWVLLIVLPRQRWVSEVVAPIAMPALFAAIYVGIIATRWKGSSGGFSSLPDVASAAFRTWQSCRASCSRSCSARPAGLRIPASEQRMAFVACGLSRRAAPQSDPSATRGGRADSSQTARCRANG